MDVLFLNKDEVKSILRTVYDLDVVRELLGGGRGAVT